MHFPAPHQECRVENHHPGEDGLLGGAFIHTGLGVLDAGGEGRGSEPGTCVSHDSASRRPLATVLAVWGQDSTGPRNWTSGGYIPKKKKKINSIFLKRDKNIEIVKVILE